MGEGAAPPIVPITPGFGAAENADCDGAESGVYRAGFRQVFGTLEQPCKRPAGGADTDAKSLGDNLPRVPLCALPPPFGIHGPTRTPQPAVFGQKRLFQEFQGPTSGPIQQL
jgi:hypothetical protein